MRPSVRPGHYKVDEARSFIPEFDGPNSRPVLFLFFFFSPFRLDLTIDEILNPSTIEPLALSRFQRSASRPRRTALATILVLERRLDLIPSQFSTQERGQRTYLYP